MIFFLRPVPESSHESTGSGLFVLQSPSKLECSDRLRDVFKDGPFKKHWDTAASKNASAAQAKAAGGAAGAVAPAFPGLSAAPLFSGGTAFGAPLGTSQNMENPVSDLWPYYKLWFEYHWKKCIKHDVKVKNSLVLRDHIEIARRKRSYASSVFILLHFTRRLMLNSGGYFTKVLVVSPEDSQQAKSHKHEEGWPKFKYVILGLCCGMFCLTLFCRTHYSARVEKGSAKGLLDRMDIVPAKFPAYDGPKQTSIPVNGVDDVVCRFEVALCSCSGSDSPSAFLCCRNSFTSA